MNAFGYAFLIVSSVLAIMLWMRRQNRMSNRQYIVHRNAAVHVAVVAADCYSDKAGIEFVGAHGETLAFFPMEQVMYVDSDTAAGR